MSLGSALLALVRPVSPRLVDCELMEIERIPIDAARAMRQHEAYVASLARLGARIEYLPPLPEHADGVFVEDTAVVLPELAVITRPGATSRQGEVESTATALARHRSLQRIAAPGTLDGGDVLRVGRSLYVGLSARTNREGAKQLQGAIAPHGYTVRALPLQGCLHLKSAVTFLPPDRVLINPDWIDPAVFHRLRIVEVDASEPNAANTLTLAGTTLVSTRYPRTAETLRSLGISLWPTEVDELHKAEAGLTCMSLILEPGSS
jgi:dimethylargininase